MSLWPCGKISENAFDKSALAVPQSLRLLFYLARCLPACRKGMRSENPQASQQSRDSKPTSPIEVTLMALALANSKTLFSLSFCRFQSASLTGEFDEVCARGGRAQSKII
jgi:hypothetical protein